MSRALLVRIGAQPARPRNWQMAIQSFEIFPYNVCPPPATGPEVELFRQRNYADRTVHKGTGFYNDPNADSNSMRIPVGWSVKTWRGDNRGGSEPRCWSESVPNLQDHENWQMAIQSFEIFPYNVCPPPATGPEVELFRQMNYADRTVHKGTGFYNDPNADAYSMRIPVGWSVKTWRGDNRGGGEPRCWSESVPNLQDHDNWQMAIQSFEIFPYNACPARLEFTTPLGREIRVEVVTTKRGEYHRQEDRLFSQIATTNAQGGYAGPHLTALTPGSYDLYVKPSGYLRKRTEIELSAGTNRISLGSFVPGDMDTNGQDNQINAMEILRVLHEWGAAGSIADVNRDGTVSSQDIIIILNNWGNGDGWQDDGPFRETLSQAMVEPLQTQGSIHLVPDSEHVAVGGIVKMRVLLDTGLYAADGINIVLRYDPGVLAVQDADPATQGLQIQLANPFQQNSTASIDSAGGQIRIDARGSNEDIIGGVGGFQGTIELATIDFKALTGIPKTAVEVFYKEGWSSDSNIVEGAQIRDVLGQADAATIETIGYPSRPMPTVTFVRPLLNEVVNSSTQTLEVRATDPYTQVQRVVFEANLGGIWTEIGSDEYLDNGWKLDWDASSMSDGTVALRATAFLPGGLSTTAAHSILLDRTPPILSYRTLMPQSASPGVPVTIEVGAYDLDAGVERIDAYVNVAPDGSLAGAWLPLGSIAGDAGSLIWDTSGYTEGWHRIAFGIVDKAGNWLPSTETLSSYELRSGTSKHIYLPLILSRHMSDPPSTVTPTPTVTPSRTPTPTSTPGTLLLNGSFEEGNTMPASWTTDAWASGPTSFTWDSTQARSGLKSIKIASSEENDARWIQSVVVQPNMDYRLSGCIKTENVAHRADGVDAGANLSLMGGWTRTPGVFGTSGWICTNLVFNSGAESQVTIAARLGFYGGTTTGTAWFDDLRLEKVSSALGSNQSRGFKATVQNPTIE